MSGESKVWAFDIMIEFRAETDMVLNLSAGWGLRHVEWRDETERSLLVRSWVCVWFAHQTWRHQ